MVGLGKNHIEDEMLRVTCSAQAIKPDDLEGALRMRLAFLCMAAVTHNDEGMRELMKEIVEFVKTRIAK